MCARSKRQFSLFRGSGAGRARKMDWRMARLTGRSAREIMRECWSNLPVFQFEVGRARRSSPSRRDNSPVRCAVCALALFRLAPGRRRHDGKDVRRRQSHQAPTKFRSCPNRGLSQGVRRRRTPCNRLALGRAATPQELRSQQRGAKRRKVRFSSACGQSLFSAPSRGNGRTPEYQNARSGICRIRQGATRSPPTKGRKRPSGLALPCNLVETRCFINVLRCVRFGLLADHRCANCRREGIWLLFYRIFEMR